ncbi:MAG: transcription repressor NadR [Firmicutes bacterium]|nr:transcription repressor NadR [Bacillota bacterium]
MSEERRGMILQILSGQVNPVSGSDLAKDLGVSRQVIVQDVAILRAKGNSIIATPQGYMLPQGGHKNQAVLAVKHRPQDTEDELNIMVDYGLEVIDVIIEHPLYGELRGCLMMSSRQDVKRFLKELANEEATLLSSLTNGVHLHTVAYAVQEDLEAARQVLDQRGFLAVDEDDL